MSEQILIVDDEKEIADLIEVYLKNDGYTVHNFIMVWMLWNVLKRKKWIWQF